MIEAPAGGCVENAKTCEIATSSGTSSCHTGVDTASPKCYTPCAALVPPSPPPSPSPPPPNGATPTPPPSGSVDFGSGSDSGDVSSGDLLADPPPLTPATSPPTTPPLSLSPAKGAGVITFSVTIAGTVDDFDSNGQYKLRLAQAVQVQEADITLLVTPASIRVTALIQVTSQSEQVVTMGSLDELVLLGPKNASSVLNVELEAIDQPTFAPSGSSTPPPSPSRPPLSPPPRSPSPPLLPLADSSERLNEENDEGTSNAAMIAVPICSILALLVCCGCALAYWRRRRPKQSEREASTSYEQNQPFDAAAVASRAIPNHTPGRAASWLAAQRSSAIEASASPPITLGSLDQPTVYRQRVQRAKSCNMSEDSSPSEDLTSPPIALGSLDQPTAYHQRVQRARSCNGEVSSTASPPIPLSSDEDPDEDLHRV